MTVNDLRRILAGGVQEKMLLVVLIIRAVDVKEFVATLYFSVVAAS